MSCELNFDDFWEQVENDKPMRAADKLKKMKDELAYMRKQQMNPRVKSLLALAHLDVMENLGDIDTNQVAKRFAELIVQECIIAVQQDDGATPVKELLVEHFGIEE